MVIGRIDKREHALRSRVLACCSALVFLCGVPSLSMAASEAVPSIAARKQQAKALFKTGIVFFQNRDLERAFDFFMQSRKAFPSIQNTSNAALCLEKLGRYGEALELFEVLLVEYRDRFTEAERESIGPVLAALRGRIGSLIVAANVAGLLVIDGRPRGKLPRTSPVRLLPGAHQLRVVADGYATFEKTVTIQQAKDARVDAVLEALTSVGQLRVEDPGNEGATVYVDGVAVGRSPWQGTLGPGPHRVRTERRDRGSAPRKAIVVQGQHSLVTLRSSKLGPVVDVRSHPKTAQIRLADVMVGKERWRGRLPKGRYSIVVTEPGYHPVTRVLDVDTARNRPLEIDVRLMVDPDHPRWPKGLAGHVEIDTFGGYLFAPSLRGGDSQNCEGGRTPHPGMDGTIAGLRVSYRFSGGTSVQFAGGYLALTQGAERVMATGQAGIEYRLRDEILSQGPFFELGVGQKAALSESLSLAARLGVGVMVAGGSNTLSAYATDGIEAVTVDIEGAGTVKRAAPVFLSNEWIVEWSSARWTLGLGVRSQLFVTSGPELAGRRVFFPPPPASCWEAGALLSRVGCAPSKEPLPDETAHEMFFAFGPQLALGYTF